MSKRNDLITGIVIAVFSLWYYFEASNIRVMKAFSKSAVNSTSMPKIWAVCMLLLAIALIVRGLRNKDKDAKGEPFSFSAWFNKNLEVVETFGALLIYIAIMDFVGFIIASIFYIFVQTLILMPKGEKSYVKAGIIAVIISVATYYIFVYWLAVLLPAGAIFE